MAKTAAKSSASLVDATLASLRTLSDNTILPVAEAGPTDPVIGNVRSLAVDMGHSIVSIRQALTDLQTKQKIHTLIRDGLKRQLDAIEPTLSTTFFKHGALGVVTSGIGKAVRRSFGGGTSPKDLVRRTNAAENNYNKVLDAAFMALSKNLDDPSVKIDDAIIGVRRAQAALKAEGELFDQEYAEQIKIAEQNTGMFGRIKDKNLPSVQEVKDRFRERVRFERLRPFAQILESAKEKQMAETKALYIKLTEIEIDANGNPVFDISGTDNKGKPVLSYLGQQQQKVFKARKQLDDIDQIRVDSKKRAEKLKEAIADLDVLIKDADRTLRSFTPKAGLGFRVPANNHTSRETIDIERANAVLAGLGFAGQYHVNASGSLVCGVAPKVQPVQTQVEAIAEPAPDPVADAPAENIIDAEFVVVPDLVEAATADDEVIQTEVSAPVEVANESIADAAGAAAQDTAEESPEDVTEEVVETGAPEISPVNWSLIRDHNLRLIYAEVLSEYNHRFAARILENVDGLDGVSEQVINGLKSDIALGEEIRKGDGGRGFNYIIVGEDKKIILSPHMQDRGITNDDLQEIKKQVHGSILQLSEASGGEVGALLNAYNRNLVLADTVKHFNYLIVPKLQDELEDMGIADDSPLVTSLDDDYFNGKDAIYDHIEIYTNGGIELADYMAERLGADFDLAKLVRESFPHSLVNENREAFCQRFGGRDGVVGLINQAYHGYKPGQNLEESMDANSSPAPVLV